MQCKQSTFLQFSVVNDLKLIDKMNSVHSRAAALSEVSLTRQSRRLFLSNW